MHEEDWGLDDERPDLITQEENWAFKNHPDSIQRLIY